MAEKEKQEIASDDGVVEDKERGATRQVPDFPTFGFDVKSEKTDIVLMVENYCLYAKKSHLQFNSPVFESMIEENRGDTLTIEGVKCADFAEFLACIQPRNRLKISRENVFRMVVLAKMYDVEDLIERCEYCLVEMLRQDTKPTGIKAISLFLDYAFKFDLETLKSECLNISSELDEGSMNNKAALERLDSDARCQLYETWLPKLTTKARLADIFLTSLKKEERQLIYGISESEGLVRFSCESTSDDHSHYYSLNKWDIRWKLCVKFPSTLKGSSRRFISIQCEKESKAFKSLIMLSAIIPNHIEWNEDKSYIQLIHFDSLKCDQYFLNNRVYLDGDVDGASLGFKVKGKLTLNVQLLFGKPVNHG